MDPMGNGMFVKTDGSKKRCIFSGELLSPRRVTATKHFHFSALY